MLASILQFVRENANAVHKWALSILRMVRFYFAMTGRRMPSFI